MYSWGGTEPGPGPHMHSVIYLPSSSVVCAVGASGREQGCEDMV
jgi:hypothetical protein